MKLEYFKTENLEQSQLLERFDWLVSAEPPSWFQNISASSAYASEKQASSIIPDFKRVAVLRNSVSGFTRLRMNLDAWKDIIKLIKTGRTFSQEMAVSVAIQNFMPFEVETEPKLFIYEILESRIS